MLQNQREPKLFYGAESVFYGGFFQPVPRVLDTYFIIVHRLVLNYSFGVANLNSKKDNIF